MPTGPRVPARIDPLRYGPVFSDPSSYYPGRNGARPGNGMRGIVSRHAFDTTTLIGKMPSKRMFARRWSRRWDRAETGAPEQHTHDGRAALVCPAHPCGMLGHLCEHRRLANKHGVPIVSMPRNAPTTCRLASLFGFSMSNDWKLASRPDMVMIHMAARAHAKIHLGTEIRLKISYTRRRFPLGMVTPLGIFRR